MKEFLKNNKEIIVTILLFFASSIFQYLITPEENRKEINGLLNKIIYLKINLWVSISLLIFFTLIYYKKFKKEIEILKQENEKLKLEKSDLENKFKEFKNINENLKLENEEFKNTNTKLKQENEKLKLEKNELKSEIEKLKEKIEEEGNVKRTQKEIWDDEYEEFKKLEFFESFKWLIYWVDNSDALDYKKVYINEGDFIGYCIADKIIIVNNDKGGYLDLDIKKIVRFTEKGDYFSLRFQKEKLEEKGKEEEVKRKIDGPSKFPTS